MTNFDRAAEVIAESITRDSAPAHEIVADLEHDGLLMPDPQIIRTVKELEALDPETVVVCRRWSKYETVEDLLKYIYSDRNFAAALPAVVVIPAEQVRVARKALEEA